MGTYLTGTYSVIHTIGDADFDNFVYSSIYFNVAGAFIINGIVVIGVADKSVDIIVNENTTTLSTDFLLLGNPITPQTKVKTGLISGDSHNEVWEFVNIKTGLSTISKTISPKGSSFPNTYSMDFDGVDDYVATSGVYSELDGLSNTAFSFWMKTSNNAGVRIILTIGTPSGDYRACQFQIWSINGAIAIYYNGLSYYSYSNASVIANNVWTHVLITRDSSRAIGDKVRIYVNGVDETSYDVTRYLGTAAAADTGLFIGEHPNAYASPFLGNIDEVAIYNQDMADYISEIYSVNGAVDLNNLDTVPQPIDWYRNGDNGAWKSPQWLLPSNENKDKVSNYSFDFDGVGDYVDVGTSLNLGTDSTISFWVKRGRVGVDEMFLGEDTYAFDYLIFVTSSNTIYVRIGTVFLQFTGTSVTSVMNDTTNWINIVAVRSGDSIELFLNGNSVGTQSGYGALIDTRFDTIAAKPSGGYPFMGNIDEVAAWDTNTINPLDIYNGGEPTTLPSGAVAHYKMGEEANFTSNWLVDNSTSPNRALKFDNTYITSPPWSGYQGLLASSTAISSDHITLSTWFKSTDSGNGEGQIFKTSLWDIKVYADRVYLSKAATFYRYWNSSGLFNGSWHNVIIYIPNTTTWDLADAKIYVDGVDLGVGTGINDGTGVPQITDIYGIFKKGAGGGGTMTAEISNWAYWLSDKRDDVNTIYNNGVPTDLSSLSPNVWWKLDSATVTTDTQVDVIDSSGNNVTGTGPRNAAKTIPALVSSIVNSRPPYSKRSFVFDGVGDKIELSTQSLGITGAISVSAWVKIPTTNTGGGGTNIQIISAEDRTSGTNRNWLFYWRGGSQNIFGCSIFDSLGTAVGTSTNSVVPNDNQWHHVMFTYAGDTSTDGLKLFVDGIQRAQATSANGGVRSTTAVVPTIGSLSNNLQWMFEGNIDEVSIFDTDQSANVSTIYNSGIPNDLTELSPLHWYRMGEDASFNGTNWTIPDQVGTNDGTSDGMMVDALVGEAPNYTGGGISDGMDIEDRVGEAPKSENNALSYNMEREDRVEDTP